MRQDCELHINAGPGLQASKFTRWSFKGQSYNTSSGLENALTLKQWALECAFPIAPPESETPHALSWGSSEELLVASDSLHLYTTQGDPKKIWEKALPNPVKSATLSCDSAYIVSVGHYDRFPKVWRRLAYGTDEVRFDVCYLRHPEAVTAVRWRKPFHLEQNADNVLYTFCMDATVRVWAPNDSQDGRHWHLWGKIDVGASVQDGPMTPRDVQLTFVVDSRDFTASVERAVKDRMADDSSTDDVALDHLVAVARRTPEIVIAVDSEGLMSAWALENVESSATDSPRIFNIAQVRSRQFELLSGFMSLKNIPHVEICTYCERRSGRLHILMHAFDGRIGVFTTNVVDLFDPTLNEKRLTLETTWSGHSAPIQKMVRNFGGQAVVSRTSGGESILWKHGRTSSKSEPTLSRRSTIPAEGHIHRISVIRKGRFVIFLREKSIMLWDCRPRTAEQMASLSYKAPGKPLCLVMLPRPQIRDYTTAHIATVTSEGKGIVWEVSLPRYFDDPGATSGAGIREFCRFELHNVKDLSYVLPVDPAGSLPVAHGFLDVFARDVAISYTKSGRVDFWTARVDLERQNVDWLSTCTTETGLSNPALVSGSMLKKAALVNSTRSQFTIWDIGGARLEFAETYQTHNVIQDLDWTSTPDSQSILAVGFQYRVLLLSQMRFDYLNKGPAWASIREISIRELTPHPIGDSTWLSDGHLVIGAGNQMFVHDRSIGSSDQLIADSRMPHRKDGAWDMFEAVQRFNGPLPVFHPQFLSQCILVGKSDLVRRILISLHNTLKYYIAGEKVDDYLGLNLEEFFVPLETRGHTRGKTNGFSVNGDTRTEEGDDEDERFSEKTATAINEKLTKVGIPQLTGHEQIQLANIAECVGLVERHRRSIDENGARFMLFFRQHALHKGRTQEVHLSWREINWAYHSNSQDILVDFVTRQGQGRLAWADARESGVFMWLSDIAAVKAQFEIIARNEYTKDEDRNPIGCSLFYLALRKKSVLQGLWRMAVGVKEQAATQRLLSNNFADPKWKTAALKNAYALLSKRRFEYAAAFFLLGDDLEGAVNVCLHQVKDLQLAIAICRVYEGDGGSVLRKVLQEEVLPMAAQEGDRWLASWAFWMLGRRDMAVRALVVSIINPSASSIANSIPDPRV